MGRWSQQRRRGSSPPGGAPAALILVTAAADNGPSLVKVDFDAVVSAGNFTGSDLSIDGNGGDSVLQLFPQSLQWTGINYPTPTAGNPWQLVGGPASVLVPQSGTVT